MDSLLHDLRFALRQLGRAPGFAALTTLCLALGIGANTTVFSLVNAVLFRPLPVADAGRLVRIYTSEWSVAGVSSRLHGSSSYPDFRALAERGDVFEGVVAFDGITVGLAAVPGAEPAPVSGAIVSGRYFDVLGVRPALGRAFLPEEDGAPGAHPVVVLGHDLWRTRFAADPAVVGRTVWLNGHAFTVVGVAPRKFYGTEVDPSAELWAPMAMHLQVMPGSTWLRSGDSRSLAIVARLKPGVSLAQARDALRRFARERAEASPETNADRVMTLVPGGTLMQPNGPPAIVFAMVMAVVALVLLIACANVANLLLARAAARRREVAVRVSLGASRARLVRQFLTESVLLALLGGAAGLLLALWCVDVARALPLPRSLDLSVDGRVLGFTLAVALLTGLLFGLAPAIQATGSALGTALKDGSAGAGRTRSRLRGALVVAQVALSLVLLAPAGLLVRSLQKLQGAHPGFDDARLLVATPDLAARGLSRPEQERFLEALLERVRALPGVEAATLTSTVPLSGGRARTAVELEGYQRAPTEENEIDVVVVGTDYFRTLGVPLLRGRPFTAEDRGGAPRVAIVTETMARRYWPGQDPVGKHLYRGGDRTRPIEVVGVARDAAMESLQASYPYFYLPAAQNPGWAHTLVGRTAGEPAALAGGVRAAVRAMDPTVGLADLRTLREVRGESLTASRLVTAFLGLFGALALALAAVGLYGVMAYTVALRTHEVGIRMALGAGRRDVLRLVLGQGLRLAAVGIAIGVLLALGVARVVAGVLYGVSAADPATFAATALLLTLAALLASYLPARRATKVEPMVALRNE